MSKILILFLIFINPYTNEGFYGKYVSNSGYFRIDINKNGTYNCSFWNPNPRENHRIEHHGTWKKNDNYLFLNSTHQPNNGHLLSVKESFNPKIAKDSILVRITSEDDIFINENGDSTVISPPAWVELNRIKYSLKHHKPNHMIKVSQLKSILICHRWTNYEIYYVKNIKSNVFDVITKYPQKESEVFFFRTYFTDEKIEIKRDTLVYDGIELFKDNK